MKCLRPAYMKHFRCDGVACQSRCCKNWQIVIDKDTLEKYRPHEEIMSLIKKTETAYVARLSENGDCAFLDADSLCRLQKNYGEDYLSDICAQYPRITLSRDDGYQETLTVSCPIAAALALTPKESMEFEEIPFTPRRPGFVFNMRNLPKGEYLPALQRLSVTILQDRRFPLDKRLSLLGEFLARADTLQGNPPKMKDFLQDYSLAEFIAAQRPKAADFDFDDYARRMTRLFAQVYEMTQSEVKERAIVSICRRHYPLFFNFMLQKQGNIMENFLVNEFFLRLYPYAYEGSFFYNFTVFATAYKLTEFALLVSSAPMNGQIDADTAVDVLSHLSGRLDHGRNTMNIIRDAAQNYPLPEDFRDKMLPFG